MAKLNWVVICERAVIDSTTNSLSLMNVREDLHISPPSAEDVKAAAGRRLAAYIPTAIVSHWERDKHGRAEREREIKLRLVGPNRQVLLEASQVLDLRQSPRARLVANLPGLPMDGEGVYAVEVCAKGGRGGFKVLGHATYRLAFLKSEKEVRQLAKAAQRAAAKFAGG